MPREKAPPSSSQSHSGGCLQHPARRQRHLFNICTRNGFVKPITGRSTQSAVTPFKHITSARKGLQDNNWLRPAESTFVHHQVCFVPYSEKVRMGKLANKPSAYCPFPQQLFGTLQNTAWRNSTVSDRLRCCYQQNASDVVHDRSHTSTLKDL